MASRLVGRYKDSNGYIWEVYEARYNSSKYSQGGYDEVIQYKQEGRERGHVTRHYDKNGGLLKTNYHGTVHSLPSDCKPI